jgi:hypothetical protein
MQSRRKTNKQTTTTTTTHHLLYISAGSKEFVHSELIARRPIVKAIISMPIV